MVQVTETREQRQLKDKYAFIVELKTGRKLVAKLSYARRLSRAGTHKILAIEGETNYSKLKNQKIN